MKSANTDAFRKAAASEANTLPVLPYQPVGACAKFLNSYLITASGRAGLAQPWSLHHAQEGKEGWVDGSLGWEELVDSLYIRIMLINCDNFAFLMLDFHILL